MVAHEQRAVVELRYVVVVEDETDGVGAGAARESARGQRRCLAQDGAGRLRPLAEQDEALRGSLGAAAHQGQQGHDARLAPHQGFEVARVGRVRVERCHPELDQQVAARERGEG